MYIINILILYYYIISISHKQKNGKGLMLKTFAVFSPFISTYNLYY